MSDSFGTQNWEQNNVDPNAITTPVKPTTVLRVRVRPITLNASCQPYTIVFCGDPSG
jgi:hypothetical protein